MNLYFEEINKNFGFGCMRLPMKGEAIDHVAFSEMIDLFLSEGFNYFDTARGYMSEHSETALRECLVKRHPREAYILTDKLTENYFESESEIRSGFAQQLKNCGVDYFDFYLLHSLNEDIYQKFEKYNAFQIAQELKSQGKVRHMGISFHDKAAILDRILTDHPEIEVVQIQFNYVDYEDLSVEGKLCYEVCRKHGKPIIVMEPVKGGCLVQNLPKEAKEIFQNLGGGSEASYAIRFAASFEGIFMVLSGVSDLDQMKDNISFMKEFKPLSEKEMRGVERVREIFRAQDLISCTFCHYCTDRCPAKIQIPDLFACMNAKQQYQDWNSEWYYDVHTQKGGKASDCIQCGKCEFSCPQHLHIRELLASVAKEFEG